MTIGRQMLRITQLRFAQNRCDAKNPRRLAPEGRTDAILKDQLRRRERNYGAPCR